MNERLTPHWSVFFQAAEGYLTPPLSVFYAQILNTVQPSTTDNYQIGTVYQRGWLSADADFYDLQYQNYIAATTIGTNTLYTNQGNTTFEGIELEATAQVGLGLALYANGSLNHANYHNGAQVAQAPRRTAVAGVLFDRSHVILAGDKLDASFLIKDVGQQYGLDTGQKDQFPIKSYDTTDLSMHYLLPLPKHHPARPRRAGDEPVQQPEPDRLCRCRGRQRCAALLGQCRSRHLLQLCRPDLEHHPTQRSRSTG